MLVLDFDWLPGHALALARINSQWRMTEITLGNVMILDILGF